MSHSLSSFIDGFNGGIRTNRFVVSCPKIGGDKPFHIRAASLPDVDTTTIQLPYRGRVFKMPGQRVYSPWTITVLDDVKNADDKTNLWTKFFDWASQIMKHKKNESTQNTDFSTLMDEFTITQLDFNHSTTPVKEVVLNRAWPSDVGEIQLSADQAETLCTFNVTMEYQYIQSF